MRGDAIPCYSDGNVPSNLAVLLLPLNLAVLSTASLTSSENLYMCGGQNLQIFLWVAFSLIPSAIVSATTIFIQPSSCFVVVFI